MQKVLIFGAGGAGKQMLQEIKDRSEPYEVLGFVDSRIGGTVKNGLPVLFPKEISHYEYDVIFVATQDNTVPKMLHEQYKVPMEKINHERYFHGVEISVRVRALEHFRELCDTYRICGSVAEVGVFQGDFAKHINRLFPESTLYLYDTFEGFSEHDKNCEKEAAEVASYTHYANTSIEMVLKKMIHPEKCVVRKGMFPETVTGSDEKYVFVSIDPDLYAPTLAGLQFFYPRLVPGGGIFVHDYFSAEDPGVKRAVEEFKQNHSISMSPLGDYRTLAIIKPL